VTQGRACFVNLSGAIKHLDLIEVTLHKMLGSLEKLWTSYFFDSQSQFITPSIYFCMENCVAVKLSAGYIWNPRIYRKYLNCLGTKALKIFRLFEISIYGITETALLFFDLELLSRKCVILLTVHQISSFLFEALWQFTIPIRGHSDCL